jgi:peptidoglycan/xylan/chitin deacetylase (PgdA/CDA1 family)
MLSRLLAVFLAICFSSLVFAQPASVSQGSAAKASASSMDLSLDELDKNPNGIAIHPQVGTIALTFDDGPSLAETPQILKILRDYHVHATFFLVGSNAKEHPELVRQILAEGHSIGNHSYTHPMLAHISQDRLSHEIIDTQQTIEDIVGVAPQCLRPPFGDVSAKVRAFALSQGLVTIPTGFSSFDYKRKGVSVMENWVISNMQAGRVFLMHDGGNSKGQTVAALPTIIEAAQKRGLGFSTICPPTTIKMTSQEKAHKTLTN